MHRERKNIKEGISEDKIKTFFLFLTVVTDNSLFKIIATMYLSIQVCLQISEKNVSLHISEINGNNDIRDKNEKL